MVRPYKQNGKVPSPLKLSPGIQKDDLPNTGACDPAGLFFEDGDLCVPGSIKDNFKKDFGAHVYDNMRKITCRLYLKSWL